MGSIHIFLQKHPFVITHFVLLCAAFLSFRYYTEILLFPALGMGWGYGIDQIIPLTLALIATLVLFVNKINLQTIYTNMRPHYLLVFFIFAVALVTHLGILNYFFWSDESLYILEPITQNAASHFHQSSSANLRGYFVSAYTLLFLVFGTTAWVYQLFNIISFSISALFVYWFAYLLIGKRYISAVAALFFAASPAYLDMFTWQNSAHAPILILGLVSFILLLHFKRNRHFGLYILSLLFFFAAIKLGFVRSAGFVFIPPLLLFSPLYKKIRMPLQKLLVYSLPYIMVTVYFVLFEFMKEEFKTFIQIGLNTGTVGGTQIPAGIPSV